MPKRKRMRVIILLSLIALGIMLVGCLALSGGNPESTTGPEFHLPIPTEASMTPTDARPAPTLTSSGDAQELCPQAVPPTSEGCEFPCVMDMFVVGITCWESVQDEMLKLGEPEMLTVDENGGVVLISYSTEFGEADIELGVNKSGVIDLFWGRWSGVPDFKLSKVLYDYGMPDEIYVFTFPYIEFDEAWEFHIALFYPEIPLIVNFHGSAVADKSDDEQIYGCLEVAQGEFFIWPEEVESDFFVVTTSYPILPTVESPNYPYRELSAVSEFTLESFATAIHESQDEGFCFSVYADPWK